MIIKIGNEETEMKFKYDDIERALFYVSAGLEFENSAILNKATGQIHYHSEMLGDEEILEDVWESDSVIAIPHTNDLNLGRNLVFKFIESQAPDNYDHVRDIFSRKGAYARYKNFLESKGLTQDWYDFENAAQEKALRKWCEKHEIELED